MNGTEYQGYPYHSFVMPFERNHDFEIVRSWFENNWIIAVYITVVYLLAVTGLQRWMADKPEINVRKAFLWWNIALSIFSTGGMCRSLPEMAHVLWNYGFEFSVCDCTFNSVNGFWISAFVFSKVVELFETTFLILRKKVTSIHLSHHVLTLLFTWNFIMYRPGLGRYVYTLNYTVHSFMYAYFALKASKVHIPESISFAVTTLQILQFFIALVASVYIAYVITLGYKCCNSLGGAVTGIVISAFFLYTFGKYYIRRYFSTKSKIK